MEASLELIYKTNEVHDCETKLVGIVSATGVSYIS